MSARNTMIARLHVLKRDMGLDDELYRDRLELLTGKRSAGELSDAELALAIAGFGAAPSRPRTIRLPATKQMRLIQAQWISLWNLGIVEDPSDAAIVAFIKRQTKLDHPNWMTAHADVVKVAEALKDWLARDGGVDWSNRKGHPPFMKLASFKVCVAQWARLLALGQVPVGGLHDLACATIGGGVVLEGTANRDWAKVSKALGKMLRATLKDRKEKAA